VFPVQARLQAWKSDIEANFVDTFSALPRAPLVREGKRVTPFLGSIKLPNQSRPVTTPGLALIGDAALATDPLWGVGCGFAFRSAEWLVDCVSPALCGGTEINAALKAYRRRHRRELAGHAFLIADFASGRPFNALERLMFSAAARNSVCADHIMAFAGREIGVSSFLAPSALARAAKANVVHHMGLRA
jgi:flavin-dependent dehydrogenase